MSCWLAPKTCMGIAVGISLLSGIQPTLWCFAVFRQLRQIRRHITPTTFQTLHVGSFSSVATGLWQRRNDRPTCLYLVRRLQSVLDESARMIFQLGRSDHITDARPGDHRVSDRCAAWRIKFFNLHGTAHHVIWVRSSVCPIYRVGVVFALPALVTWSCHHSNCPLLAAEHFRLLLLLRHAGELNIVTNVTHFSLKT